VKNKIQLIGVIGLITVMGLFFTSCNFSAPVVTISGTPQVGMQLTASSSSGFGMGTFTGNYIWQIRSVPNAFLHTTPAESYLSGSRRNVLTIPGQRFLGGPFPVTTVGAYIRVGRALVNMDGGGPGETIWSNYIRVEAAD